MKDEILKMIEQKSMWKSTIQMMHGIGVCQSSRSILYYVFLLLIFCNKSTKHQILKIHLHDVITFQFIFIGEAVTPCFINILSKEQCMYRNLDASSSYKKDCLGWRRFKHFNFNFCQEIWATVGAKKAWKCIQKNW